MTIQKRFRNPSFLQLVHASPHGIVVNSLLLVCTSPLATAHRGSSPSPPPPDDQSSLALKFNPPLAIIMVVLVSAFFFAAFFYLYVRQVFRAAHSNPPAGVIAGVGRGSWRMQPGLDSEVIEAYFPTFLYYAVKGLKIGKGTLECAVCLNEFEDDETLRLIPKCSHVFHRGCIDAWLASHTTCPVCRANLVPKPDDLSLDSVHTFETGGNTIEAEEQFNVNRDAQGHVAIHVGDDYDRVREAPQTQSREVNLLNPPTQSRAPRSWSSGWRLNKLFPRSHSTGHSLVQPGQDLERFTLRLPEGVGSQLLLSTQLNRTKSCVAFSRARSSRKGYRSSSAGTGRGRTHFCHEWFNPEGQPSVITRNRSAGSLKGTNGYEENASPSKHKLRSVRSLKAPLDCFFPGLDNNSNHSNKHPGERPFDPLIPDTRP